MSWTAAIIGICIFSFLLGFISFNIKEKKLEGLKGLLFLLSALNTFLIPGLLYLITLHPNNIENVTGVFLGYFITHMIALIAVIWIYSYYLFHRTMDEVTK